MPHYGQVLAVIWLAGRRHKGPAPCRCQSERLELGHTRSFIMTVTGWWERVEAGLCQLLVRYRGKTRGRNCAQTPHHFPRDTQPHPPQDDRQAPAALQHNLDRSMRLPTRPSDMVITAPISLDNSHIGFSLSPASRSKLLGAPRGLVGEPLTDCSILYGFPTCQRREKHLSCVDCVTSRRTRCCICIYTHHPY